MQQRPTELDRAYLKAALGRRKTRTYGKAIRAAGLYGISREVGPAPAELARTRWQDVEAHDWRKAWMGQRYSDVNTVGRNDSPIRENIDDVMDAIP